MATEETAKVFSPQLLPGHPAGSSSIPSCQMPYSQAGSPAFPTLLSGKSAKEEGLGLDKSVKSLPSSPNSEPIYSELGLWKSA